MCALSLFGLYSPDRLLRMVSGVVEQSWGIHFAVGIRLVLGAALIVVAATSRFPVIFEVLGWITLAAAIGLVFFGRERMRALVAWLAARPMSIVRTWLVFGAVFGGFLVYGIPIE